MKNIFILAIGMVGLFSCSNDDDGITAEPTPKVRYCDVRQVRFSGWYSEEAGISRHDESTWIPYQDRMTIQKYYGQHENMCTQGSTYGVNPTFIKCDTCYYLD